MPPPWRRGPVAYGAAVTAESPIVIHRLAVARQHGAAPGIHRDAVGHRADAAVGQGHVEHAVAGLDRQVVAAFGPLGAGGGRLGDRLDLEVEVDVRVGGGVGEPVGVLHGDRGGVADLELV